ncbi:YueI family protein [Alkalihalobacillus trypoxylicola]|uniref:DUF1694 domain-containing protein n=1 Tax=Alkalihalobacillus trypoxylicola TaxID=519424 RepID=A0A161PFZ4_9BACI|nr:YueI family protein [Alkalihalobacillus trypoxylicola]KYG32087.1 hypothetical protein AZF04_04765 [Alkalihalobacillus trypoxylicola]
MNEKVQQKIDHALYGIPQVKVEERNLFLSTIVERIYYALTLKQVQRDMMYNPVLEKMNQEKNLHLYINGNLSYATYSKYVKVANSKGIAFTITTPPHESPFGLVLATKNTAIDREQIFIEDEWFERDMEEAKN